MKEGVCPDDMAEHEGRGDYHDDVDDRLGKNESVEACFFILTLAKREGKKTKSCF